nr:hypothetical protein [Kofleriaceae bacterium]
YRVSTWAKTNGLAMLVIRTRDFAGAILTEQIIDVPPSQWSYLEGTVISSANTYMVEVALRVGGGSSAPAWFDDVRILETNGFMNPGFETRSTTGVATEIPGWKIQRGDGRIDRMGPPHRRAASLVLEVFSVPNYTLVSQTIVHVPGRRYRIGGWAKIDSGAPVTTATVRRFNAAGANAGTIPIPVSLTSGNYAWFERTLELADLPANTAKFDLELRVDQVGRTRFDDLYLAILP